MRILSVEEFNEKLKISAVNDDALDNFIKDNEIFIDLHLPSGTLWQIKPEKTQYTYEEALDLFGESELPTVYDFEELFRNTRFVETRHMIYGICGTEQKIFFPLDGYQINNESFKWKIARNPRSLQLRRMNCRLKKPQRISKHETIYRK